MCFGKNENRIPALEGQNALAIQLHNSPHSCGLVNKKGCRRLRSMCFLTRRASLARAPPWLKRSPMLAMRSCWTALKGLRPTSQSNDPRYKTGDCLHKTKMATKRFSRHRVERRVVSFCTVDTRSWRIADILRILVNVAT